MLVGTAEALYKDTDKRSDHLFNVELTDSPLVYLLEGKGELSEGTSPVVGIAQKEELFT